MNQNLTELIFILDRSGSMFGLEPDTIGGFNGLIQKQKGETGQALVSTILFSNQSQVLHDRVPVEQVRPMTTADYQVGGGTALLDAIGDAIHHIRNVHKYARPEDVPARTMMVITTDGMENRSCRYTLEQIKADIQRQKQAGWEFLFLGANMDAVGTAGQMGIHADHAVTYQCDAQGMAVNYEALNQAITNVRNARPVGSGWKEKIQRDRTKRGK